MSAPALVIRGLAVRDRQGHGLVRGVDLTLPAGGILTLIGETGSGKSLIAQAVMGLLPDELRAEGAISVAGREAEAGDKPALRRLWATHTMVLPQEPSAALDPTMRLLSQLAETAGRTNAAGALDAVELSGAAARAWPHALSGGMAQRGLAAMALVSNAPLLVADEPTKGLDDERVEIAIRLLASLRDRGKALLAITHDLRVARGLGGAVAVIRDGVIVEQGSAEAVLSAPTHAYTRAWLEAEPARWPPRPRSAAAPHPVLVCEQVGFGYTPRERLAERVSLSLRPGEIVGLCGVSGRGKTTLGNVLLGLHRPHAGTVKWIGGADPYADPPAQRRLRRQYQKLHQDPVRAFVPFRSLARQFADLKPALPPRALSDRLPELLDRVRIKPSLLARKPAEISGGEAQRLAIVRLLLLEPRVIVADEPTSRLDPIVQREVIELLTELARTRNLGLILISHDQALLDVVTDRKLLL